MDVAVGPNGIGVVTFLGTFPGTVNQARLFSVPPTELPAFVVPTIPPAVQPQPPAVPVPGVQQPIPPQPIPNAPTAVQPGIPPIAVGTLGLAIGGPANGQFRPLNRNAQGFEVGNTTSSETSPSANVRPATADINGDGVLDTILGTGPGVATNVRVVDGSTGKTLALFQPFEASFTGGVFVTAGDIDGDGKSEVVVSPDQGGGPLVAVYSGSKLAAGSGSGAELIRFFGIEDLAFRGGTRPALGDINGDRRADLVVSAGILGGPRIAIFDGATLFQIATGGVTPRRLIPDFFAFEDSLRNGAFVGVGDLNGDGRADIAFGGGPGGSPRIRLFDGAKLLQSGPFRNLDEVQSNQLANFFAGSSTLRGGVRLAIRDLNGDGRGDLAVGSGEGEPSRVRIYYSANLLSNPSPNADQELDPYSNAIIANGVFVG
jgi:hypothetical protein